jgi:hypothetical protein
MRHRLAVFGVLFLCGCGAIPTAPDSDLPNGELVYVNESWRFQVSRPTLDWGISAQIFLQQRYNNGLPAVEVHISSPLAQSLIASFRPEFYIEPKEVSKDISIDGLAIAFEESELKAIFQGYEALEEKQKVQITNGELIEWRFRNSPFSAQSRQYPGTRFLAAVAVYEDQGYFMIGNGSNEAGFPLEEYRLIAESIKFAVK